MIERTRINISQVALATNSQNQTLFEIKVCKMPCATSGDSHCDLVNSASGTLVWMGSKVLNCLSIPLTGPF